MKLRLAWRTHLWGVLARRLIAWAVTVGLPVLVLLYLFGIVSKTVVAVTLIVVVLYGGLRVLQERVAAAERAGWAAIGGDDA
jgi:hypothetical protein